MNGHLQCSHIEILPLDWCRRCWQHKGGHQMSEIIEATKFIIKQNGNFTEDELISWVSKTSHDVGSFKKFMENTLDIYKNGFKFEGAPLTGGKGTTLPRICKELEWGQDGRHRVSIAYVLGVETLPIVIHTTDRDFDDGFAILTKASELINEFYHSQEWEEYKKTVSFKILSSTQTRRVELGLDCFSKINDPPSDWDENLTVDKFHDKLLSHPKLGDLKIHGH